MNSRALRIPARLAVAAVATLGIVVVLATGRADGAERSWSVYLAPVGACTSAEDATSAPIVQRRAVRCLVNWARAQDSHRRLAPSRALRRAAVMKGKRVAECKQFSHTPCNADVTAAVRASGYRFSTFGENLFAGAQGTSSAREVVAAWLRSPSHRETLLHPEFREVGAARVVAPELLGSRHSIVWVTAFAAPG
ncbi:MAG: CAP domain-containing protein [Gaiellaceae bacterium]